MLIAASWWGPPTLPEPTEPATLLAVLTSLRSCRAAHADAPCYVTKTTPAFSDVSPNSAGVVIAARFRPSTPVGP
ncbi:hypothetical protein GCM10018966_022780 [Streptomyces yanii]